MMSEDRKFSIEEVEAVDKPPRAPAPGEMSDLHVPAAAPPHKEPPQEEERLADKIMRKKDYLEGFLAQKPAEQPKGEAGGALYDAVIDTLKSIYDPEIPVNIYDLGLIYGVEITPDNHAIVTMTLTTPHCPVAESMPGEIELQVGSVPGVGHSEVHLVWDPPWDPQKMSDEAKLELGML